jgi:enamine deaminase RidA (YjgF/YER057c/UK114 family)
MQSSQPGAAPSDATAPTTAPATATGLTAGANRPIAPTSLAPPAANYSHAVLSVAPARLLHTSGVVPTRLDGSVPGDVAEQAEVVWSTIRVLLGDAGMAMSDVVSVVTYVVAGDQLATDLQVVMAARDRAMAGHRPASTLVTVPALARPEWRMEVAVVAAA